jgi:hypothetical protein
LLCTEALLVTLHCARLQKRKVLADPSLPPEFRISLAKSLRHDLFSKVLDSPDSVGDYSLNFRKNKPNVSSDSFSGWYSGACACHVHSRGKIWTVNGSVVLHEYCSA